MEKRKIKVSILISVLVMVVQLVVLVVLYSFVNFSNTKNMQENTVASMQTMVKERSLIIENYVKETERYLTSYSRAGEISDLLKNPTDSNAVKAAQAYTEAFSADMDNLEGIYASEWNTHVLAHTNPKVVGMVTREGEAAKGLQDILVSTDGVYNAGFIFSPASGKQIISLYQACYDENGNPIGLVGGGIYISGLKEILDGLPVAGLEQAKYYLINAKTGEYIFHEDEEKLGTVAEEEHVLKILSELEDGNEEELTNYIEYDEQGVENIAAYHYVKDRGWLFLLTDTSEEIFATTKKTQRELFVLCIVALIVLMVLTYVVISVSMKPLSAIGRVLLRIAQYDISNDKDIKKITKRRDDLGAFAQASETVIASLRDIVCTLRDCCMQLNKKVYSLKDFSANLVDCVTDNISTTEELSASLENVNGAIENINGEISSIHSVINEVAVYIQNSDKSSVHMSESAMKMRTSANTAFLNSKKQLDDTKVMVKEALESLNKLSQINGMASSILEIADQTNLLSINASIEAARTGEAGRGFAVVAGEIGKLAENSKNTASRIQELCDASNESIADVNDCVQTIMKFVENDVLTGFEEFAMQSNNYSTSVELIRQDMQNLKTSIGELTDSIEEIVENIEDVQNISSENKIAIVEIVQKSESIADIAIEIQKQSEENKQMADSLEDIINKFTI